MSQASGICPQSDESLQSFILRVMIRVGWSDVTTLITHGGWGNNPSVPYEIKQEFDAFNASVLLDLFVFLGDFLFLGTFLLCVLLLEFDVETADAEFKTEDAEDEAEGIEIEAEGVGKAEIEAEADDIEEDIVGRSAMCDLWRTRP